VCQTRLDDTVLYSMTAMSQSKTLRFLFFTRQDNAFKMGRFNLAEGQNV
jgi:hypothetical protein